MAMKKSAPKADQAQIGRQSATQFFGDVKGEFQKITWTEGDELKLYTKIVVAATGTFGLAIYGIDLFIQGTLSGMGTLVRLIIG